MFKLRLLLLGIVVCAFFFGCSAGAVSGSVVISQVQLGTAVSASNEFVEVYNNSDSDVEVTNWCLYYASATNLQNGSKMSCLTVENTSLHLFLPNRSFALFISNQLATLTPTLGFDGKFSATLSGTAGHVRIMNGDVEVDKIGWGASALSAEGGKPVPTAPNGNVLSRQSMSDGVLKDTDVNSDDFELVSPKDSYKYGSIYEKQDLCGNIDGIQESIPDGYISDETGNCTLPPVDVCPNLDGLQVVIPSGYSLDENGGCQPDICQNIDGLQLVIPEGMDNDGLGNCLPHDECPNIPEVQASIPEGYIKADDQSCILKSLPLVISEMLPNAVGPDEGNEFIEVYNPNDQAVNLNDYQIVVNGKTYEFPDGDKLVDSGTYYTTYNNVMNFTLVNTSSIVSIRSKNGSFVGDSIAYQSAQEGESWALIEGTWQYTNQPTPGSANLKSIIEVDEPDTELQPCGVGQYRSPDTNRCRNIVTDTTSELAPCQEGYERNPETNRCRKIVTSDGLVPCQDGYERNPETNRCNKITSVLGASDLAPCQAGYERNPDTNRCRKMTATMPAADYQPKQTSQKSSNLIIIGSIAVISLIAVGYGIWEWRKEISKLVKKIGLVIHPGK